MVVDEGQELVGHSRDPAMARTSSPRPTTTPSRSRETEEAVGEVDASSNVITCTSIWKATPRRRGQPDESRRTSRWADRPPGDRAHRGGAVNPADRGLRLGRIGAWLQPRIRRRRPDRLGIQAESLGYPTAWLGFGRASVSDLALAERILGDHVDDHGGHRDRQHVDQRPGGRRRVVPADRRQAQRPLPAGDRHRPPRIRHGIPAALRDHGELPRPARCRRRPARPPDPGRARPQSPAPRRGTDAGNAPVSSRPRPYARRPPDGRTRCRHRARAQGRPGHRPRQGPGRGRAFVSDPYLKLSNYTGNLRRYGYTEADFGGGGSDDDDFFFFFCGGFAQLHML